MSSPHFIFTGYAPNEGKREYSLALSWLFKPSSLKQWRKEPGNFVIKIETWLQDFFKTKNAYAIDSGRSALLVTLQAMGIGAGDEVLVQAFTCVVVVNAIRWVGATPVFVDCTDNFTTDPIDVARKITPRCKALIVQHTFGYSADVSGLISIAKNNSLKVIEDCAHALEARTGGKLLGTFGDAAIFSFGSDKVVSAVRGGAVITDDNALGEKIEKIINQLPAMPMSYLLPHVLHVPFFYLGKKYFTAFGGVGKWLLAGAQKLGIINRVLYVSEKTGEHMRPFPTRFPNVLAAFVQPQLTDLEKINSLRREQAKKYFSEIKNPKIILPPQDPEALFLRFPVLVANPIAWHIAAKKERIQLGDWYDTVIAPKNATQAGYTSGNCPLAEKMAEKIINLPMGANISEVDQNRVINFINSQT